MHPATPEEGEGSMVEEQNAAKRWLAVGALLLLAALFVLPQPRQWLGSRLKAMVIKMHSSQSLRSLHGK
jgi:hypothetical protein